MSRHEIFLEESIWWKMLVEKIGDILVEFLVEEI